MDMEKLATLLEAVKVLPLRPQDFIVLRTNVRLDPMQAAEIHLYLEEQVGHTRILVLDRGADIDVLRIEECAPAPIEPAEAQPPAHRPVSEAAPPAHPNHRPIARPAS